jgi:hypothetical protein
LALSLRSPVVGWVPCLGLLASALWVVLLSVGCGGGTEADRMGVAAECRDDRDCLFEIQLECLDAFRGGYCGLADCVDNLDCPESSACVAHTDGRNYCFRLCDHKSECNRNRSVANEANCSSNITFTEPATIDTRFGHRACVPPSG